MEKDHPLANPRRQELHEEIAVALMAGQTFTPKDITKIMAGFGYSANTQSIEVTSSPALRRRLISAGIDLGTTVYKGRTIYYDQNRELDDTTYSETCARIDREQEEMRRKGRQAVKNSVKH